MSIWTTPRVTSGNTNVTNETLNTSKMFLHSESELLSDEEEDEEEEVVEERMSLEVYREAFLRFGFGSSPSITMVISFLAAGLSSSGFLVEALTSGVSLTSSIGFSSDGVLAGDTTRGRTHSSQQCPAAGLPSGKLKKYCLL